MEETKEVTIEDRVKALEDAVFIKEVENDTDDNETEEEATTDETEATEEEKEE